MQAREVAYCSNADVVISVWRQKVREHEDHHERLFAQLRKWGFEDSKGFQIVGHGLSSHDFIVGVLPIEGREPPPGWRADRESGTWVPKLTTTIGKRVKRELEAVQPPNTVLSALPGMDDVAWVGHRVFTPGMFVLDEPGVTEGPTMYLHWGATPANVDSDIWQEIKMSAWYLAKEASEQEESVELSESVDG